MMFVVCGRTVVQGVTVTALVVTVSQANAPEKARKTSEPKGLLVGNTRATPFCKGMNQKSLQEKALEKVLGMDQPSQSH